MKQNDKIEGGYYIMARSIEESEIAGALPQVREIWNWLIRNANFTDRDKLKRGQLICTNEQISQALSWMSGFRKMRYSDRQCGSALEWLTGRGMISKERTTRGNIITIWNYDRYQTLSNYGSSAENSMPVSRKDLEGVPIHNTFKTKRKNNEYTPSGGQGGKASSSSEQKGLNVLKEWNDSTPRSPQEAVSTFEQISNKNSNTDIPVTIDRPSEIKDQDKEKNAGEDLRDSDSHVAPYTPAKSMTPRNNIPDTNITIQAKVSFEEFWKEYNKGVGRAGSEVVWKKLSHADQIAAIGFIPKYKSLRPDKQYRKNPEGYLTGRVWEDEITAYNRPEDVIRRVTATPSDYRTQKKF